jgi:murein DD-endopeptidase MepM/ murein hydrolase activator NlpD
MIEVTAGEESQAFVFTVREGTFPQQQLTLPAGKVSLSPEDEERANREAERLRALWPRPSERLWDGAFIMPLENGVSTQFGTKRIINGKKKSIQSGLDIRGKKGEEVKAANDGRVALAEELFFGGNTIVLDHGQGIFTIYMHLSRINVSPDSVVLKGDVIGLVGSTGRSTGPHLHYGVKVNAVNANPRSLAGLPLPGEEGTAHGPY